MKTEEMIRQMKNIEVCSAARGEYQGEQGLFVFCEDYGTETFFSDQAMEDNDAETLMKMAHQGRNVEGMTRVTGFFSKTRGWNRGKTGELKERSRSCI